MARFREFNDERKRKATDTLRSMTQSAENFRMQLNPSYLDELKELGVPDEWITIGESEHGYCLIVAKPKSDS